MLLSRFYEKAEESTLPGVLGDCMTLFRSEALFLLLSNFTGLRLHFLAPSEEGGVEDTTEGEAASAPDSTDEGTSRGSSEPLDGQAAISSSDQRSSEQTDPEPEENEAEKGEPQLGLVPVLRYAVTTRSLAPQVLLKHLPSARPCFRSWRVKQTRLLLSLTLHTKRRGQIKCIHQQLENIKE